MSSENTQKKKRSSDLFIDLEIEDRVDARLKAIIYCTFQKAFTLVLDQIDDSVSKLPTAEDVVNTVSAFCQVNRDFALAAERLCVDALRTLK